MRALGWMAIASCVGAVACTEARPLARDNHGSGSDCCGCHIAPVGEGCDASAPLRMETTYAVHAAHVTPSDWHRAIDCDACHPQPLSVLAPEHLDAELPADLRFGAVATSGDVAARFDPATGTCLNHCHGAAEAPSWRAASVQGLGCDACHGLPPAAPHPARTDCASCHPTVDAAMQVIRPSAHIDGTVDLVDSGCGLCHGSPGQPAPPSDVAGETATSARGVGAHREHLRPSPWHARLACSQCHRVPSRIDDAGHIDDPAPAELVWGPLASARGAAPAFDAETLSCADVYCHGGAMADGGGTRTRPVWTEVDGTQSACGSCHALPPRGHHVERTDCSSCHGMVIDAAGAIIAPSLHINGRIDVEPLGCNGCHGSADNAAPPRDTHGREATSARSVGAHQSHLRPASWHAPVPCEACHRVPQATGDAAHLDGEPGAEVVFGELATAQGVSAAYAPESATCTVYCHGAAMPEAGGGATLPVWTRVDGSQASCSSCHGFPPTGGHVPRTDCGSCHGASLADPMLHIDGRVEVDALACDGCHGSGGNAAPPRDLRGRTATTYASVGAHRAHVDASSRHAAIPCTACHRVPTQVDDPGHMDSELPAEIVWGVRATQHGATPAYDAASASCSATYCHGATLATGVGTDPEPQWTRVDGTQATCASCHGNPPGGRHPQSSDCHHCHAAVIAEDNATFSSPTLHVNGNVDVEVTCTSCHGMPPAAPHPQRTPCSECHGAVIAASGVFLAPERHRDGVVDVGSGCSGCHGGISNAAPPRALSGATSTLEASVGAHQSHLKPSNWRLPMNCNTCHLSPATRDAVGHMDSDAPAELFFSGVAAYGGGTYDATTKTCDVYCHEPYGVAAPGATPRPVWNLVDGSQGTCGSCHGNPPSWHGRSDCWVCHDEVMSGPGVFANPAKHINGVVEWTHDPIGTDCDDCH